MKQDRRRKQILKEMAGITRMEKGSLTEEYREKYMDGEKIRLGPYYKYQRWEQGRNVSRRVPAAEAEQIRDAVDGYHKFETLAKEYAEITIGMTRQADKTNQSKKKPKS